MTKRQRIIGIGSGLAVAAFVLSASAATAQVTQRAGVPAEIVNKLKPQPPPAPLPNYIIGPDDVLNVNVYNEEKVSGQVTVRPDGKITLPVGNDIMASGLTVDQLKEKIIEELKKGFFDDPTVYIQVKEIKSRLVYITGSVNKPGPYQLTGPMTVSMLISVAGGLQEYAKKKNIILISATLKDREGKPLSYKINYDDLEKGRNLDKYNIELRPGDTVIVPGGGGS